MKLLPLIVSVAALVGAAACAPTAQYELANAPPNPPPASYLPPPYATSTADLNTYTASAHTGMSSDPNNPNGAPGPMAGFPVPPPHPRAQPPMQTSPQM